MDFIKYETDTSEKGSLQIHVTSAINSTPIENASINIFYTGLPDKQLEQLTTNSSGQTETIELETPPLEYSLNSSVESTLF